MIITTEEKLMYTVMKAIYDSGIPVNFKGSMVLKACLAEAGYADAIRRTVDIDANWNSDTSPTTKQIAESFQNALNQNDISLDVDVYREYGEGRSAGLELRNRTSKDVVFTMDVDVNRPFAQTKIYEISDMSFRGVAPMQILSDKVFVVSTDKVFRRIKDVIDLYYLSQVMPFDYDAVMATLKKDGRKLGDFNGFRNRKEDLRHSFEKFRFSGDVNKPEFDDVYDKVNKYISQVL